MSICKVGVIVGSAFGGMGTFERATNDLTKVGLSDFLLEYFLKSTCSLVQTLWDRILFQCCLETLQLVWWQWRRVPKGQTSVSKRPAPLPLTRWER